ncbi:MAG: nucleoside recognition domain-containing protein [Verrucomicrobiales bacterium]
MLNYIWLGMVIAAVVIGAFTGQMRAISDGAIKGAETAVTLAIGLVGVMALWLGMMRLAEMAGLIQALSRFLRPLLVWLFPDVPPKDPAMGAMVMNIAANMLGLNNAATPLGLRAMRDLERLNRFPGTASNAMCTFLTVNTGAPQLIPITAIAVLAGAGAKNPNAIIGTAFFASVIATIVGIIAVKILEKLPAYRLPKESLPAERNDSPTITANAPASGPVETAELALKPLTLAAKSGLFLFFGLFVFSGVSLVWPELGLIRQNVATANAGSLPVRIIQAISILAIPFMLSIFPLFAAMRGIKVYEEFVEGAKEGFNVAIKIIPFLVGMLVAISMFRASEGITMLTQFLDPVLKALHFPGELLPMAIMRPISGSGSLAILSDMIKTFGPDHLLVRMAGTIYGSTETTFYVLAVYFGSVGVRRTRHAVPAGLISDVTGIIAAVVICRVVFGS